MTAAWNPPKHLPIFFDIPDTPPDRRIRIRPGMSPLRLSAAIIRSAGWYAVAGCLLLVIFHIAGTLLPIALGAAIDRGISPMTTGTTPIDAFGGFMVWVAVIAGLYIVVNLTYRFGGRMGWFAVQRARYELSSRVAERAVDARGISGTRHLPGRMLSIATSDSDRACSALYFAIYPLGNVVAVFVAAAALLVIHPVLGAVAAIGAPVLLGAMAIVARPLRARIGREQEAVADASAVAADLVGGTRELAGIHAQSAASAQYRVVSRSALRRALDSNAEEAAVVGSNVVLTGLFSGVIAVLAAMLAFSGEVSVGGLIAAAALAQSILGPLTELIESAATLGAETLASARRVLDVLHREPHPDAHGVEPIAARPHLRLLPAHLGTPIDIAPGEFIAIDPSVVDGDDLAATLTLMVAPGHPRAVGVTLDGRDVREHDPDAVREAILVAPHTADLFEATVLANVLPPSRERTHPASLARARAALRVAHCESLEHELPRGYDTPVRDGGRTLSGGQRQRVALARAIAYDPQILVLHDPLNAVDAMTEHAIATRLHSARRGLTTVVLTSSPAFHAVADRSVDMQRE